MNAGVDDDDPNPSTISISADLIEDAIEEHGRENGWVNSEPEDIEEEEEQSGWWLKPASEDDIQSEGSIEY